MMFASPSELRPQFPEYFLGRTALRSALPNFFEPASDLHVPSFLHVVLFLWLQALQQSLREVRPFVSR